MAGGVIFDRSASAQAGLGQAYGNSYFGFGANYGVSFNLSLNPDTFGNYTGSFQYYQVNFLGYGASLTLTDNGGAIDLPKKD